MPHELAGDAGRGGGLRRAQIALAGFVLGRDPEDLVWDVLLIVGVVGVQGVFLQARGIIVGVALGSVDDLVDDHVKFADQALVLGDGHGGHVALGLVVDAHVPDDELPALAQARAGDDDVFLEPVGDLLLDQSLVFYVHLPGTMPGCSDLSRLNRDREQGFWRHVRQLFLVLGAPSVSAIGEACVRSGGRGGSRRSCRLA